MQNLKASLNLLFQRPSKQFYSHVETGPPLSGYYQHFWGENLSCSRTQLRDPSGVLGVCITRTCLYDVFLIWIRSEQCKNKCARLSCEPNNQLNIIVCTISVMEDEVAALGLVSFQTDHI